MRSTCATTRLTDLGLTEALIRDNLMFPTDKIGSTMTVAMTRADAASWFGAAPPDLTVEARVRGKDWLYSYLLAFYRDEKSPTGWNNLVYHERRHAPRAVEPVRDPEAGRGRVRGPRQGRGRRDRRQGTRGGGACSRREVRGQDPGPGCSGHPLEVEYRVFVADLVNYLDYMAEPIKNERINIGIVVLIFLGVLFALVYSLKRDYWKEVH